MKTFLEFQSEISSGKLSNVYYISANDNYFVSKAGDILREKLFGSVANKDNFFLRYADESSLQDINDLCSGFSSLFSSLKLVVVKRCEKYSRKLNELLELSKKTDKDTYLLLVFDQDFAAEKKLYETLDLYDFSELPQKSLAEWVRNEFMQRKIDIDDNAIGKFIELVPDSFDMRLSEIEKISNYDFSGTESRITADLIQKFIGYDKDYSPEELIHNIINKDQSRSFRILDILLNTNGLNEIYLLSIISNYYMDLISYKAKGMENLDSKTIYGKYKLWGDKAKFAKNYHKKVSVGSLERSFAMILDTDKKLKTSMLNS
ncbi:MAG: DNA polymerase III subunit delta, partial [Ignavibacteria bacterium]